MHTYIITQQARIQVLELRVRSRRGISVPLIKALSSIWVQLEYHLRRYYRKSRGQKSCHRKSRDRKRSWTEEAMTGSNVITGSMFCACPAFPALFSYYSSSTKCSTVVQVPWLRDVTGHVTHSWFPWVCAWATISCAITSLVGPFDRKWRYEGHPKVG